MGRLALVHSLLALTLAACPGPSPGDRPDVAVADPLTRNEAVLEQARRALERGDGEEAARLARALVEADPRAVEARIVLASAELLAGRPGDALREANVAHALDADLAGPLVTKAAALAALGEREQATDAARAALRRDPDNPGALRNLSILLAEAEAWEAHAEALARLSELDPRDLDTRMALARAHVRLEDEATAVRLIEEVVTRDPRRLDAQLLLAALAWDRGDHPGALERARFAKTLAPDSEAASRLLDAAFYVVVAVELTCLHGPPPWRDEDAARVLTRFAQEGLRNVVAFFELHDRLGADPGMSARVARGAATCGSR